MAANPPSVKKACLTELKDNNGTATPQKNCHFVEVHFNPASLVYSVESSTPQSAADPKKRQFAAQFTGKLTMDLVFDTTGTGDDVRIDTNKVAYFMQPSAASTKMAADKAADSPSSAPPTAQPVVMFEWGVYQFRGVMESFRETIDFFSAEGVPLRASVSISLARQDQVFDDTDRDAKSANVSGSIIPTPDNGSAQKVADQGGDSGAARQLASDNGLENLRFTAGASLQVNPGVQLNPAAGFAAGASASGGVGVSLGASAAPASAAPGVASAASIGASAAQAAAANLSAGAATGATFGSSASMGVPAVMGAFSGLQTGRAKVSTTAQLDPARMLRATSGADVSTYSGATFSLGGAANNSSGAGLSSDVGASLSFRSVLTFDNDD
jgi:Contractile injection system tube protein